MSDDHIKAHIDAVMYGTGYLKDGKHVPHEDVYLDPRDARITALIAAGDKLAGFAGHDKWSCDVRGCSCGYTDAWKKWQEVRGDE